MEELRAMYEKTSVAPLGEVDLPEQPQTTTTANAA
jgi:hypothetical protein